MEVMNCLTLKDLGSTRKAKTDSDGRHAHKENIFLDRSRTTPMKNEPIDLSKHRGYTPERSPITPVKLADRQPSEPWTPTANLKMLISAASPDIRDREKKKELFRPIENNEQEDGVCDFMQFETADDGTVDEYEKRPSRKQKSLGLLCQKFLARYPSYPLSTEKTTISLDEVAGSLGVERRRIYDIVNVLESLHLVSRVAKNQYCWHGRHGLNQTLKNLQCLGTLQKYEEQIAYFQHREADVEYRFGERRKDGMDYHSAHLLEFAEADFQSAAANSRKDKSLRIMSQKFVMLFLVSTTNIVTLDIAAKILIEESQDVSDHSKFKTKVRRLYDIANVLTSLGLIKKVHVTEERGRKPAFKWIGPVDFNDLCGEQRIQVTPASAFTGTNGEMGCQSQTSMTGKQKFSRHASFTAVQRSQVVKRKVSSEPNSPHRDRKAYGEGSDDYSTKMAHLAAVCRQKIEENTKGKTLASEKGIDIVEHPGALTPFSIVVPASKGSEYCLSHRHHNALPAAHSDIMAQLPLQSSMHGHAAAIAMCSSPKTENGEPARLSNQPFVCLPSASVFMLCGNLQDGSTAERVNNAGDGCSRDCERQALPERSQGASPASSPGTHTEDEEPAAKMLKTDMQDDPLSLVLPKRPSKPTEMASGPQDNCMQMQHRRDRYCEAGCYSPRTAEENDFNKPFGFQEQKKMVLQIDHNELVHPKETCPQESMTSFPQYLYVPSAAGLNGFNFLLSANQAAGAVALTPSQLASLNVPCVMVPSSALAQFPFLCSPSVTSQLPSTPCGSSPNAGSVNFNFPGMASATHLLIGAAPMVPPKTSELPSSDQRQVHSPGLGSSGSSVKTDSPVCRGQPVAMRKGHQSPTPQTPKNIRRKHHETFFKTPGSLGDPIAWRNVEGSQSRNCSSAQRRLEISSGGTE